MICICFVIRLKTGDDKTSVLFHNDLCDDMGSLEIVIYNSGMLYVKLMLSTMKTAELFAFMVSFGGVKIDTVSFYYQIILWIS